MSSFTRRSFLKKTTLSAIAVSPAVNALSKIIGAPEASTLTLINYSCRLTEWRSLLNLDFFFINASEKDGQITAKYKQDEVYMIVRLPQQHIAEQYFDMTKEGKESPGEVALTFISGYSYLAFRIIFRSDNEVKINLTQEELLDWGNIDRFRLVVRQHPGESLFQLSVRNSTAQNKKYFENTYPFGYKHISGSDYEYSPSYFPKIYGDPITAIEAPWRLIIAPKLPDQDKFRFKWEFSKRPDLETGSVELWMATLTVEPNPTALTLKKSKQPGDEKKLEESDDAIFRQLNIVLMGSPDHLGSKDDLARFENKFLPAPLDRHRLVELYVKYKLLARANKLSFSGLGISTLIEFKNSRIDDVLEKINLYSYKQLISFGRDEEVEVTEVMLEKETGLKMLLIRNTKRRFKGGLAFLDYREYIMPLEIEKDYQNHIDGETGDESGGDSKNGSTALENSKYRSKFNAPFKKIRFIETQPKRIMPIDSTLYTGKVGNLVKVLNGKFESREGIFYPQVALKEGGHLMFEMEITDWHDKTHKIRKTMQLITGNVHLRFPGKDEAGITVTPKDPLSYKDIEDFFTSDIKTFEVSWTAVDESYRIFIKDMQLETNLESRDLVIQQASEFRNIALQGSKGISVKLHSNLLDFEALFIKNVARIQALLDTFKNEFLAYLPKEQQRLLDDIEKKIRDTNGAIADKKAEIISSVKTDLSNRVNDVKNKLTSLQTAINATTIKGHSLETSLLRRIKILKDVVAPLEKIVFDIPSTQLLIVTFIETQERQGGALFVLRNKIKNERDSFLLELKEVVNDLSFPDEINTEAQTLLRNWDDFNSYFDSFNIKINDGVASLTEALTNLNLKKTEIVSSTSKTLFQVTLLFREACDKFLKDAKALRIYMTGDALEGLNIRQWISDKQLINQYTGLDTELKNLTGMFKAAQVEGARFFNEQLEVIKSQLLNSFRDKTFGYLNLFEVGADNVKDKIYLLTDKIVDAVDLRLHSLPNAILTQRKKIGYAINKLSEEADEIINDELSALQTDFIVLNGAIKTTTADFIIEGKTIQKEVIDFYHQYASIPQLEHAEVLIPAVCKLVNEEFTVGVKMAEDYFRNQSDLVSLEIEKNKSRIFAEIKDSSKSFIEGKIRNISSELGGLINPELPSGFLTYLRDPRKITSDVIADSDIQNQIVAAENAISEAKEKWASSKKEFEKELRNAVDQASQSLKDKERELQESLKKYTDALKTVPSDLILLGKEAKDQWNAIQSFDPATFFQGLEAKVLGAIPLKDILGIEFETPRLSPVGDEVTYNFITKKLKAKDFSLFRFGTNSNTQLQIYLNKKLKTKEFTSFIKLNDFNVAISVSSQEILLIKFKEFQVKSTPSKSKSVNVKIDGVAFGGPLDFFGSLAEKIKMPGSGLRVIPSLSQLEIGYAFPIPGISSPAFNFTNIKFDVALKVAFANSTSVKPLLMEVGINRPDDKFLISVGIFGGRGHFTLAASPHRLEKIDAALEYGGYIGINLGIASGYVFLFAGIRMIYESSGDLTLVGYVICEGGVTVFGFISIYLTVELAMTYRRIGGEAALYGSARLRYSFKIGFFKKSFSISFSKQITGSKGKSIAEQESQAAVYHQAGDTRYASIENDDLLFDDYELVEEELFPFHKSEEKKKKKEDDQEKMKSNSFRNVFNKKEWERYCNSFQIQKDYNDNKNIHG